ncbi:MAG TPA: type II secretion system F family protein [Burkholderiales bacterium]|nr:type II secretion system F family protein [Burkholderiales bacterium]
MKFQIKALSDSGGVVLLALDAADEADADRQVRARGCNVLSLRRSNSWSLERFTSSHRFPLALFNQELLALLGAGLTLVESIEALAEKEAQSSTRTTLDRLIEQLRHGRTLSQAMQEQPDAFPVLYVSTVRATERTGDLTHALQRYVAYESQLEVVRKKVISALIYPVLLMAAGSLVLFFLLGYVIPRFSMVYDEVKGNLPLVSRLLLQLGTFISAHGAMVVLGGLGAIAVLGRVMFTRTTRRWIGAKLWRVPAIGRRMRLYQLARFYRTLGMLLRGGTAAVAALDMAAGLLSPTLRLSAERAREAIREGRMISEAMELHGLTTPVALRMLRVGERSGRMDDMMDRIAAFLDEEIARWVDWFTRLFEPLLMAFIGLVIGAIVILMYMPVFELAGSIQ